MDVSSKTVVQNILRFFLLILFQVLVLNHINLGGFINPYYYVLFILLLPFNTPRWLLLISALLLGTGVDLFTNTPGLNAAACLVTAFIRPFLITLISSGPESLIGDTPSLKNQGIKWFLYYSITLVLVHHCALFFLEIFRLDEFFRTLLRVILSSLFTLLLVLITEYLVLPGRK